MNRASTLRRFSVCLALSVSFAGCKLFSNYGTGAHMDAPRDHPHDTAPGRVREMLVEVTTDAEGNVAEIRFRRSSGKEGIDGYVAQSIRDSWPRQPLTRSVASLDYSADKGFSSPKIISSTPL